MASMKASKSSAFLDDPLKRVVQPVKLAGSEHMMGVLVAAALGVGGIGVGIGVTGVAVPA